MIITNEIILQVGACTQGFIDGITQVNLPEDYQVAIAALQNGGRPDLANWLKAVKVPIIEAIGNYTLGGYRVQDITTGEFQQFDNLSDAQAQVITNGKNYVINQKQRFSVNVDTHNPDGSVSWVPVDPFTFDTEDDYQVFNTFTGQYEYYPDLASAKAAQQVLESQVAALVPGVQQQITSSDGTETAWILVPQTSTATTTT